MTQFPTSSESTASAIRFFGKPGGLIMVVMLLLSVGGSEAKIRKNIHVPAIMKRLYIDVCTDFTVPATRVGIERQMVRSVWLHQINHDYTPRNVDFDYRHKALEGCESPNPVFSILANGSESTAGSTIIEFNLTYGNNVDAERTRLSLDLPRGGPCVAGARPPPELELRATASGWTGTRQLRFRRRGASYVTPLEAPLSLVNGTLFRLTISVNESWVLPCPMSEVSASLILNYPSCHHSSRRRFRRHLHSDRDKNPRRRSGSNPGNGLCRRIKLYVEFRDMGWDEWVLAPGGYWAHQCDGRCVFPMSAKMNVTNHATVKSLVHSMVTAGVRAPCCVPVKLAPQNLLYIDSYGHVVLKTFPDMTVTDCGCR